MIENLMKLYSEVSLKLHGTLLAKVAGETIELARLKRELQKKEDTLLIEGIEGKNAELRAAYLRSQCEPELLKIAMQEVILTKTKTEIEICQEQLREFKFLVNCFQLKQIFGVEPFERNCEQVVPLQPQAQEIKFETKTTANLGEIPV